jgi:phosphoserine phosphatase
MTTLHRNADGADDDGTGGLVLVKGAPEAVLPLCRDRLGPDGPEALDAEAALALAEETARTGYRLLAFAERKLDSLPLKPGAEEIERDLTFLGLVALADPPRPEAAEALASCHSAGIEVAMITGDHPATAKAIASRLGMAGDDARVMTGAELQGLTEDERRAAVAETRIYARVSPEQKLDIVTALQQRNHFVAMTGDGVNDAPALKRADIGVAMGLKGTDVAREAADAVLLDDNFATIVAAVREGRRIYANICKFIKYTMTSNSGEIWTILLAPFLGLPLPLLPIQILWINLVTDGLPGLALGVEPEERDSMKRPPRQPDESVFAHGMWQHMLWVGLLIAGLSLGAQAWAYHGGSENWRSVVFTVLTFCQLVNVGLAEQSLADRRGAADRGPAAGRGLPRAAAGGLQDQRPVGRGTACRAGPAVGRAGRGRNREVPVPARLDLPHAGPRSHGTQREIRIGPGDRLGLPCAMSESHERSHAGFPRHRLIGLLAGPAAAAIVLASPAPDGLSQQGWWTAAVGIWMALWWMTEALPLAVRCSGCAASRRPRRPTPIP